MQNFGVYICSYTCIVFLICSDHPIEWKYGLGSFQLSLKAVDIATESFIRINEEGIMCIQHQVNLHLFICRSSYSFGSLFIFNILL
jgi:hypothetical protein